MVKDLTGQRFGRLVVASRSGINAHRAATWLCICDCGNKSIVATNHLKQKNTQSCGCMRDAMSKERFTKHGLNGTRVYRAWRHMHDRCGNPNNAQYKNYGGRGIAVCESWQDFQNFLDDMGQPPPGMSLERIDNNLGYCKSNCRWATAKEQSRNRRVNNYISYSGITKTMTEWAEEFGINPSTFSKRLRKGWDFQKAIRKPGETS